MRIQIRVDGVDLGGGVCLSPSKVLTARHVVENALPDIVQVWANDGDKHRVTDICEIPRLDVAVLTVDAELDIAKVGEPRDGDSWKVAAPPASDLPYLSGVITVAERDWLSSEGFAVTVMQLLVNEDVQDFHGYSGSPVYLPEENDAVVALVLEQQPVLLPRPGEPIPAANVLYAVRLGPTIEAAGLTESRREERSDLLVPACITNHDKVVVALRGYRSRLTSRSLAFIEPDAYLPWSPNSLWSELENPAASGMVLLTGYGGVGKTRTLLEVARLASAAGWLVLHVRGGNASRVADHLNERLARNPKAAVLLVVDYLNAARELDLLALAELVAQFRTPEPRLSILASSRAGWERKHRHDLGMDRLGRVALDRSKSDTADICRSIARQVAPQAVAGAGLEEVLRVTGCTRPILAVLLGQIVEDQFVSRRSLPAALVSEELAGWLEDRLREDELLPPVQTESDALSRLVGAAAGLAGSPAARTDIITAIASAVGEEGDYPEQATHITDKLLQIGWLEPFEAGLAAAHDVVADKVLEGVLFYDDDRGVRRDAANRLFDTAFTSAAPFVNIISSVERVLNERDSRSEESTYLLSAAQAWLDSRSANFAPRVTADPEARSRVVNTIIRSELFNLVEKGYWQTVVWSLIESLSDTSALGETLLTTCRFMPRGLEPRLLDMSVDWLIANGSDAGSQLIAVILQRRDMRPGQVDAVIDIALSWLQSLTDLRLADTVLIRLLRRSELRGERLRVTTSYLLTWVAQFGDTWAAPGLLRGALERPDLDTECVRKLDSVARTWLGRHPLAPSTAYVLPWLITAADGDRESATVWHSVQIWLTSNLARPEAGFVVQTLLGWSGLTDSRATATWAAAERCLAANPLGVEASYLLQALLSWTELTDVQGEATWTAAHDWLTANPTGPDTSYVLQALLGWAGLTDHRAISVWAAADTWLVANSAHPDATHVIEALLRWSGLTEPRAQRVLAAAVTWLAASATRPDANFLLQALIRHTGLSEAQVEIVWTATATWLEANQSLPETSFLLPYLLAWSELTAAQAETVWTAATTWLAANPTGPYANFLLQALLGWSALTEARAETVWAACLVWLNSEPELPDTSYLLQALLGWSGLTAARVDAIWSVVTNWFRVNATGSDASYLLGALLDLPSLDSTRTETVWAAASIWLTANSTRSDASHLIQALLGWSGLTEPRADTLWTAIIAWLAVNSVLPSANYLLQALLAWSGLTETRAETVWDAATAWLATGATRPGARFLLQGLLRSAGLTASRAETVWRSAITWLAANNGRPDASRLMVALLDRSDLSETRADTIWDAAVVWLKANADDPKTHDLLRALLVRPGLTDTRADTIWEATTSWLAANPTGLEASYLLRALLDWPELGGVRANTVWTTATTWLAAHSNDPMAYDLLRALLDWPSLTDIRAETVWNAAIPWLTANADQSRAHHLVRTLVNWPGLTEEQFDALWAAMNPWLAINAARRDTRPIIMAVIGRLDLDSGRIAGSGGDPRPNDVWSVAMTWLDLNLGSTNAAYLLLTLIQRLGPSDFHILESDTRSNAVWSAARRWLGAHPARPKTGHLLQALLAWEFVSGAEEREAFVVGVADQWSFEQTVGGGVPSATGSGSAREMALRWAVANPSGTSAGLALGMLAASTDTRSDAVDVWRATTAWLMDNPLHVLTPLVLALLIDQRGVSEASRREARELAIVWLRRDGESSRAQLLLRALLKQWTDNEAEADELARLTTSWLRANKNQIGSTVLIRAARQWASKHSYFGLHFQDSNL